MQTAQSLLDLRHLATQIRIDIIEMLTVAGSGHAGGALGMADIFTTLYFSGLMQHRPHEPNWPERDRVVLSNGHICPVWYATLAEAGYFPRKELLTLRRLNSRLQGHPSRMDTPGVENSSGPLGQGFSQAIGMALAAQLDKRPSHIFALLSDGEHNEGQTWEAMLFAAKQKLHNLTVIIDRNNIQIDGFTDQVMPLEPFRQKYEAFGWYTIDINGNDFEQIIQAIKMAKENQHGPTAIIAHTVPGKGVEFMENKFEWHGKAPNKEEAQLAVAQLKRNA